MSAWFRVFCVFRVFCGSSIRRHATKASEDDNALVVSEFSWRYAWPPVAIHMDSRESSDSWLPVNSLFIAIDRVRSSRGILGNLFFSRP